MSYPQETATFGTFRQTPLLWTKRNVTRGSGKQIAATSANEEIKIAELESQVEHLTASVSHLVMANRTAQVNQIRGLLGEFGIVVATGFARFRREMPRILE